MSNASCLTSTCPDKQSVISGGYPGACSQILLKSSFVGWQLSFTHFFKFSSPFRVYWVLCTQHLVRQSSHKPCQAGCYLTFARPKTTSLKQLAVFHRLPWESELSLNFQALSSSRAGTLFFEVQLLCVRVVAVLRWYLRKCWIKLTSVVVKYFMENCSIILMGSALSFNLFNLQIHVGCGFTVLHHANLCRLHLTVI